MADSEIMKAFNLMWGNFPEPVMLVSKNRDILAVNKACSKAGGVAGIKCTSMGTPEQHKNCRANQALSSQQATYCKSEGSGNMVIAYWIPVDGYPEIYIHFGVGTTINYNEFKVNS